VVSDFILRVRQLYRVRLRYPSTVIGSRAKLGDIRNIYIESGGCIADGAVLTTTFPSPKPDFTWKGGNYIRLGKNCQIRFGAVISCSDGGDIDLGDNVLIGPYCLLFGNLSIGSNTLLAPHVVIVPNNHNIDSIDTLIKNQTTTSLGVKIAEDVWLGTHVTILDGVSIGRGAVIGASAVVTKDIPNYAVAVGNPAKVIRYRN